MRKMKRVLLWSLAALLAVFVSATPHANADEAPPADDALGKSLPHDYVGPFVKRADGAIVALEGKTTIISRDNGQTWESHALFADAESAEQPIVPRKEQAMLITKEGTLIAAFLNNSERRWTWSNALRDAPDAVLPTYIMRSIDGGQTWQKPHKLHDEWSGAVRDIIQTKDGRIIFTTMKMLHNPGRHTVVTYSSDDDGLTWQASNVVDLGGSGNHGGVSEASLVELRDGRVWLLIRTNWGEFWSGYSVDGGRFWRVLQPSGIAASSAPGLVKRLHSGRLVLIWNRPHAEGEPISRIVGGNGIWSEVPVSNYRAELSLAFSEDEGRTWTKPVVIGRAPRGGKAWVAYPYLFEPEPGTLWVTTMQGGLRTELLESELLELSK